MKEVKEWLMAATIVIFGFSGSVGIIKGFGNYGYITPRISYNTITKEYKFKYFTKRSDYVFLHYPAFVYLGWNIGKVVTWLDEEIK